MTIDEKALEAAADAALRVMINQDDPNCYPDRHDVARAAIAAYEAALWKDIESAPKDGTVVLLAGPWVMRPARMWRDIGCWSAELGWLACDDDGEQRRSDDGCELPPPRYWRPLPAPPKGDE